MSLRAARNTALVLGGLVALYAVAGAFALPPLARHLLVDRASRDLGRPVALDRITFNPFTLEARLHGLRVMEPDGRTRFAGFDDLSFKARLASLWQLAPVVDEVTLTGLRVTLVRDGESHYNFNDVLERIRAREAAESGKAKDKEPARFSVGNLRVVDGAIDFDDRPNGARHAVSAIELTVPRISNLPTHVREQVLPRFSATVDGSPFEMRGESLPFDPTMRSRFDIAIRDVDLAKFAGYVPSDAPVRFGAGKLDAAISVRFAEGARGEPAIDVAGRARFSDVALSNSQGPLGRLGALELDLASLDPLAGIARIRSMTLSDVAAMQDRWKVKSLQLGGITADLPRRTARIESLASRGGDFRLERAADGTVAAPATGPTASRRAVNPWNLVLASAEIAGYRVTLVDRAMHPAVTHAIEVASLQVKDLSTAQGLKGEAAIRARLDRGGSIDASSTFALEPLQVKGTIDARNVDLAHYRPYLAYFPAVAIRSGEASAKGRFEISGQARSMQVTYDGDAAIDRLVTVDTINKEDLLNWKSLKGRGMRLAYAPDAPVRIAVADLAVDGAYSRLVVTPEGKLNVQELISAPGGEPQTGKQPPPPRERDIRIDRISFTDSRLNFTDHYIKPNYTADVGALHGSVTKLSSDPSSRAIVALQGKWDSSSPVLIAGSVNPLRGDLFLDVAAKAQEIDLTKLTAYSQRYAGYGIKEGRLTLDVKYHLDGGKLEGRNRILVDQLAFGDKVDSPDATKLPVLFAVNLLKDKNGRIDLELPISGSLEDPQFEITAVIGQIFGSRLRKAETSPFSLIAAGEAGNPDELAYVEFEPGRAELTQAARGKLDTLARILDDRPGLKLALAARVDEAADVDAMKAAARAAKLAALPKDAPKEMRAKAEAEPIELGVEERRALMQRRDEQVRAYLCGNGKLAADRVVVAAEPFKTDGVKARVGRVDFALR